MANENALIVSNNMMSSIKLNNDQLNVKEPFKTLELLNK